MISHFIGSDTLKCTIMHNAVTIKMHLHPKHRFAVSVLCEKCCISGEGERENPTGIF